MLNGGTASMSLPARSVRRYCSTSAAFVRVTSVTGPSVAGRALELPPGDTVARQNHSSGTTVSRPTTGRSPQLRPGRNVAVATAARDGRATSAGRRASVDGTQPAVPGCGAGRSSGARAKPGGRRATPLPVRRHDRAGRGRGFEGGAQRPLASPLVYTRGRLAHAT